MNEIDSRQLRDVLDRLLDLDCKSTIYVAFSGGIDSTVLLHMLHQAMPKSANRLVALHCDHGIHPESRQWEKLCEQICSRLGIEYRSTRLSLVSENGKFSEEAARNARYSWLRRQLDQDDILVTAHHRDDQAETVLLNLMRGAGARGLAAIQPVRKFGDGFLVRPMLDFSKDEISDYARRNDLNYIEDPSNLDTRHDRNYLRHVVIPSLNQRWPSAATLISRSASQLSNTRGLLEDIARLDATQCRTKGSGFLSIGYQLSLHDLRILNRERQINLIRYWVRNHSIREPGLRALQDFTETAIDNDGDFAQISWDRVHLYKFQEALYLARAVNPPDSNDSIDWDLKGPLSIESMDMKLMPEFSRGKGLNPACLTQDVSIRFRRGGESIQLARRSHSSKLKKLYQEHAIPPWERNLLPLIYSGDKLAAVVPWIIAGNFAAAQEESGISVNIEWIA